jgi:uncharacterized protein DUF6461
VRSRVAVLSAAATLLAACASSATHAGPGTGGTVEVAEACAVTIPPSSLVNDPAGIYPGGRCRGQSDAVPHSPAPTSIPVESEPPPPPWTGTKAEKRFAWAEEGGPMEAACVTLVRGVTPRQALEIITTDRITAIGPAAQAERIVNRRSDATLVTAGRIRGGWTLVLEVNGFNATVGATPRQLSRHGTAVVIFRNVNALTSFQYAVKGALIREFDPLLFGPPWTGQPLPQERGIRFGDEQDVNPMAQSFLLAYRLTGVALTRRDVITTQGRLGVAVRI